MERRLAGLKSARRIVYIEDSAIEREIVCRLLESEGCEVMATASPQTGLELVRRRTPDIILLDLHMPEMDGYEVVERMREIPALHEVPIVAVSASIREEEREEVYEKFDGYLKKPIDLDSFPGEIMGYIERGREEARAGAGKGKGGRSGKGLEGGPAQRRGSARGSSGDVRPGAGADEDTKGLLESLERIRSTMAHDLRSPLTVMISYASTVGREKVGNLTERQKEMLDLVVEQGFKMDVLISELVQIARDTLDRYGYSP